MYEPVSFETFLWVYIKLCLIAGLLGLPCLAYALLKARTTLPDGGKFRSQASRVRYAMQCCRNGTGLTLRAVQLEAALQAIEQEVQVTPLLAIRKAECLEVALDAIEAAAFIEQERIALEATAGIDANLEVVGCAPAQESIANV